MNTSLRPETNVRLSVLQLITVITVILGFGWMLAKSYFDIQYEIVKINTRLSVIEGKL